MDKLHVLSHKMQAEPTILREQVTPALLREAIVEDRASYREADGVIIAFGVLRPRASLFEVGSLWTDLPYRRNGLTAEIFRELLAKVPVESAAYLVSSNERIQRLAAEYMVEVTEGNIDALGVPNCTEHTLDPNCKNFHCRFHHLSGGRKMFFLRSR